MSAKIHVVDLQFKGTPYGIASFIVETDLGLILVESGPHSTYPVLKAGIEEIGYTVDDVKHVLLTHIHLDHAGAAWVFAEKGADVYVHPVGYRHIQDPSKLLASAQRIYGDMMDTLWGTLKPINADQLHTVKHEEKITIHDHTFIAHHTPGHAVHHIAWQMDNIVFTGDVAGIRVDNGPVIPPTPPPDINIEAWQKSIDILLKLKEVDTYYLTHFGKADGVQDHMLELKETLNKYANFFKPHYEAGAKVEDIISEFESFVKNHLREMGITDEAAAVYEYSNPSAFSAYGLMRYWHKRDAYLAESN